MQLALRDVHGGGGETSPLAAMEAGADHTEHNETAIAVTPRKINLFIDITFVVFRSECGGQGWQRYSGRREDIALAQDTDRRAARERDFAGFVENGPAAAATAALNKLAIPSC